MDTTSRDDVVRLNGIEAELKVTAPICKTHFVKQPMKVQKGVKQYLFDDAGTEYLDCCGNIPHVGHCHPHVTHSGQKQIEQLTTAQGFVTNVQSNYAKALLGTVPKGLFDTVLLVNSGSEAVDLALRLAQGYTKRRDIVCPQPSLFGHSSLLASMHYKFLKRSDFNAYPWIHHIPICNKYRGAYAGSTSPVTDATSHLRELLDELKDKGTPIAGFITEIIHTSGGNLMPPDDYLPKVVSLVKEAKGLVIVDEVLTGLGRLGTHWWAFQHYGIKPDIVVCGRCMGNGQPLAAVMTSQAIGNPISCAMGMAVLDVISNENMLTSCATVGQALIDGLIPLIDKHPNLGDVRGKGLCLYLDIVEDKTSKKPGKEIAERLSYRLRDQYHVLIPADGPEGNCLFICPPLCFSLENSKELVESIDFVLTDLENGITDSVKSLYELNEKFQVPGDIFSGFMKRKPEENESDAAQFKISKIEQELD